MRTAIAIPVGFCAALAAAALLRADAPVQPDEATRIYGAIRAFELTGGSLPVSDFTLTRDRIEMTFTGTFHFAGTVENRVTGAVFIGRGTMRAAVPPSEFERDHVRRLIGADTVESDFTTAVLRWTDDTIDLFPARAGEGGAPAADAARVAAGFEARLTRETGVNLASRLALSIVNRESPGLFFVQFEGGRRARFNVLVDHQHRIPVSHFNVNGGEKGLVFAYRPIIFRTETWMAFYSADDYARGTATYSDVHNLVDVTHYDVDVDLTRPDERLSLTARMTMNVSAPDVRAIPFILGEGLSTYQDQRLQHQLHVRGVRVDGAPAAWTQEDWESGLTIWLPQAVGPERPLTVEVDLDGRFLQVNDLVRGAYYPISNTAWLPRHGYLDRATFDLEFRHRKRDSVASVGTRVREEPDPSAADLMITTYQMTDPVALVVFALGPFERHRQEVTFESGGDPIPLEFHKLPDRQARIAAVKEDFVLAELDNSLRYFAAIFGRYPYKSFGAAFHPYPFGQGFPTMLMLAPADQAAGGTFAFISHETAHQWWGNIVAWRSYRDQWLSEGFAQYSSVLYTGLRDKPQTAAELLRDMRQSLLGPPRTLTGAGRGRLNDVGPIILGHRLNSSQSFGAYQALVYNKGALVLRMLHYLLSDPAADPIVSGDGGFNRMMAAFVEEFRDDAASTDDFRAVANRHFASSPVAVRTGTNQLNWFFRQWVYQTGLPSYRMEYQVADQAEGAVLVTGTVFQDNVPADWMMPVPVVFTFDGDRTGRSVVHVRGASSTFEMRLPMRPRNVQLDPDGWILSERTATTRK
ncbi:MAG TPA: M1 family aminopeptidase [Vicinamibacterales bacterium]|nr:M1 family aminopeptidase [Vicinamibacterales bacterium]